MYLSMQARMVHPMTSREPRPLALSNADGLSSGPSVSYWGGPTHADARQFGVNSKRV